MIQVKSPENPDVRIIAGAHLSQRRLIVLEPFAEQAVSFLSDLSKALMAHHQIRSFPDVATFAFWCRPTNLERLKNEIKDDRVRVGRGLALHIAPSNVPVNFAYSFAFGLLAGNANIVRLPENLAPSAVVLTKIIKEVLNDPKHSLLGSTNTLLSYPRNDSISQTLSAGADLRLLWGGDETVRHLRKLITPPRCLDIAFADRYSLSLISAPAVLGVSCNQVSKLARSFYNDAFLMDQNACSSPHLVLWQGLKSQVYLAQERFWRAVNQVAKTEQERPRSYTIERYTHLTRIAIRLSGAAAIFDSDKRIFRVALREVPNNIDELKGQHGFFFESIDNNLSQLSRIANKRYQTLTYFGMEGKPLVAELISKGIQGIDRVVPVGKALEMDVIWDGYNLIDTMSRIVSTT